VSVHTEYDEKRDFLRDMVNDCIEYARQNLLDTSVWGYNEMRSGYELEVYKKLIEARDAI
jgi:hypothetical protein